MHRRTFGLYKRRHEIESQNDYTKDERETFWRNQLSFHLMCKKMIPYIHAHNQPMSHFHTQKGKSRLFFFITHLHLFFFTIFQISCVCMYVVSLYPPFF